MACSSNSIIHSSSSSSSSSAVTRSARNHKYYDVFVSFSGETRSGFIDHLFGAFKRKGIVPFRDDTNIQKGESLTPELHCAIQVSQIYIVIFSEIYPSSTWCMLELEYILQCVQLSRKPLLPLFYDVSPSEVRKQSGSYAKVFVELEERFKQDLGKVLRWRKALTQVADLSGWEVGNKPQYAIIEEIGEKVISLLELKTSSLPKDLVGMDYPVQEFLKTHLRLDKADEVRVVGISGTGGIGKTTLATTIYRIIANQFDACCYIDDVSKIFRHDGLIGAQKQILHQTLGKEHLPICNLYDAANLIRSRLRRLRVLIFLDNVDSAEQLEKLDLNREWLAIGSRIVIISREEHILNAYGVDAIYKVPLLNESNSLQLFSQKAFKLDHIKSSYEELAHDVLNYANCVPLAIKVLGSFLFGRATSEWRSALARLRESPNKNIMDVLRLSFDVLEETEIEMFLHIACYFDQQKEEYVKNVLNCCGFNANIGLRVLIDKSLISISAGIVQMHDLLRDLGTTIAQENFTAEPRKCTRLWRGNFDFPVELMEKAEALCCYGYKKEEMEILKCEALSRMSHLRLLILLKGNLSGRLHCLSNELRYIEWSEHPFKYLPSNFHPNQLVELSLKHSSITKVWNGGKYLPNLRNMDLSYSKCLIKLPHFGEVPNLERLNLEGCVNLMVLDPSIGVLENLVFLSLKDCKNLRSIPNNIFDLSSLEYLNLSGCSKVLTNTWYLNGLHTSERGYYFQSTYSILKMCCLPWLVSFFYSTLEDSLPPLASLFFLRELDIGFCGVRKLPDAIGCLHWLERLNLEGNNFVRMPSLADLSKLIYLNLQHCKHLKSLPELPSPTAMKRDQCWRRGGMYLFNCPRLHVRERCGRMAFSWMIQFIQANQESSFSFDWIDIVIPGSEIPSWFHKQSKGCSIQIDPSPMDDFIGIALCAVFSVAPNDDDDDDPTTISPSPCEVTQLGFRKDRTGDGVFVDILITVDRDLITVKSIHSCLVYFTRQRFFSMMKDMDFHLGNTQMEAEIMNDYGLDVDVTSCGYCWVYKEDLHALRRFLC